MRATALFVLVPLTGCVAGLLQPTYTGCSPQIPEGYEAQGLIPVGTLKVLVQDADGAPLASKSIYASYNPQRSVVCAAGVFATTGKDGRAVLERMRVGEYRLNLLEGKTTTSGQVAEGMTTRVVLVDAPQ